MLTKLRHNKGNIILALLVITLACGWITREWVYAQEQAKLIASQTLNLADLKMQEHVYEGTPRGKLAVYYDGQTAGTKNFQVGQFWLRPGTEPHPIHKHAEEEILIVAKGKGVIHCDGKDTKVAAGAVMYTGPNAPHSIRNTGDDELVFYWVKWIGVPTRK
jgi:mannose-6-phosphate isomerase-like protein (cupin superfamily)